MDIQRSEVLPGIWLSSAEPAQKGEACISINLLTPLERDTAPLNELVVRVLRRGTFRAADDEKLASALSAAGSMRIEPLSRCIGEIQCIGIRGVFTPVCTEGKGISMRPAAQLLADMIKTPATRGGLLIPSYVDEERTAMCAERESAEQFEIPLDYAIRRCLEEMCCFEEYPAGFGYDNSQIDTVKYKKLTPIYRNLLTTSPMEIFYCGKEKHSDAVKVFKEALAGISRGELNYDLGTDIRMNSVEEIARIYTEDAELAAGDINAVAAGYRFGDVMDDPDAVELAVVENLLQSLLPAVHSSVYLDRHKGVLVLAVEGLSEHNMLEARLSEVISRGAAGDFEAELLEAAKQQAETDFTAIAAQSMLLEQCLLECTISGPEESPSDLAQQVAAVSAESIQTIFSSLEKDLVFNLRSSASEE